MRMYGRRWVIAAIALVLTSMPGDGQADKQAGQQQRRAAIREAIRVVGLNSDQVAKIREIRRERPPEAIQGLARREWRAAITAKLMAVLTDDQKAKLDEVKSAGPDSKAFEGAVLLGFVPRLRRN